MIRNVLVINVSIQYRHISVTAGLGPDHCDKANIAVKPVTQVFGFPVHTATCSNVVAAVAYQVFKKSAKHLKNNVDIFIKNTLLLKHGNHHLSLQWVKIVTSKITDYRPPQHV